MRGLGVVGDRPRFVVELRADGLRVHPWIFCGAVVLRRWTIPSGPRHIEGGCACTNRCFGFQFFPYRGASAGRGLLDAVKNRTNRDRGHLGSGHEGSEWRGMKFPAIRISGGCYFS